MKIHLFAVSALALFFFETSGCNTDRPKGEEGIKVKVQTPIPINLGVDKLVTFPGAGATLVFNLSTPSGSTVPDYWVVFRKRTPCAGRKMVLPGTSTHPAQCDAKMTGTPNADFTYTFGLDTAPSSPPQSGAPEPPGFAVDGIVRCFPCQ